MFDFIERLSDLSNYAFRLGIANATIDIKLDEDTIITSSDFLQILEKGSPLRDIVATRPIERTFLMMQNKIRLTYEQCIDAIVKDDATYNIIRDMLRRLAQRLNIMLKNNVTENIRADIVCNLFYKGIKIN